MNDFLPFPPERIAVVALTRHGLRLAATVCAGLPGSRLFAPEKFARDSVGAGAGATFFSGRFAEQMPMLFADFDGIVAIVSLGAMVRLVAPHLKDKASDPGIVVVDEAGKFAIPMLAGHLGGANALAARLARALGATPVYTTASDARATLAVDLLGREFGWRIEAGKDVLLRAAAAVVNDEPVALVQETGRTDWWASHANGRAGALPANLRRFARIEEVDPAAFDAVLWISERSLPAALSGAFADRLVTYRPAPEGALSA
jgi:cobalt-precorrin 5A hydrolase